MTTTNLQVINDINNILKSNSEAIVKTVKQRIHNATLIGWLQFSGCIQLTERSVGAALLVATPEDTEDTCAHGRPCRQSYHARKVWLIWKRITWKCSEWVSMCPKFRSPSCPSGSTWWARGCSFWGLCLTSPQRCLCMWPSMTEK